MPSNPYPYPPNLNASSQYFDQTCPRNYFLSKNTKYGEELEAEKSSTRAGGLSTSLTPTDPLLDIDLSEDSDNGSRGGGGGRRSRGGR